MSIQDSSVTPPMSSVDDQHVEINDDDDDNETIGDLEKGEYLDIVESGQQFGVDSQTNTSTSQSNEGGPFQDDVEDDSLKNTYGKGKRAKTSIVHKEMQIIKLPDGTERRKCNWCNAQLKVDNVSHSTSSAKKHLLHCKARVRGMAKQGKQTTQLKISGFDNVGGPSLETWNYNHCRVRELAAHMVLGHEFPFSIMEGEIFNRFLRELYPWYGRITRHTVKTDCESFYAAEKDKLKKLMETQNRVSLTTDLWWSSEQKIGYMTVTCHYIDPKWVLHKRVLAFLNVPPPHSGEVIARELIKIMDDWRIKDKVVSITLDNASANDNCISRLKEDFTSKKSLVLDGQLFHVRCCAHILNLLVQDGLDVIKDVVDKIRCGMKYILSSEKRCLEFGRIVKLLELKGRLLVLDTKTRWNSTWRMLSTACFYRSAWPRYAEENAAFAHYLPNESDWDKVKDICDFLEVFADITEIISGSYYPTVNLFLAELHRVKILLDESIELTTKPHLKTMAKEMKAKYDKYWSQGDILLSIGAVLDPRYKMKLIGFAYPAMYGEVAGEESMKELLDKFKCLFMEYEKIYKKSYVSTQKYVGNSSGFGKGKRSFENYLATVELVDNSKSELEIYLDEMILTGCLGSNFDVLQWWMVNECKYPILSKLAKDVLSIPVTSVASESTFSSGKRIIDPKRASMKVETVEMLLCGGDWVKEIYGIKKGKGKCLLEEEHVHLEFDFAKLTLDANATVEASST